MENVIIFGVGQYLDKVLKRSIFNDRNIIAFCDNDKKKWGKFINNIEIVSPEKINEFSFDEILISTPKYEKEIKKQLQEELGIPAKKIKDLDFSENKYKEEISFWLEKYEKEGNKFNNAHYEKLFLSIAQEENDYFWNDKIVLDFGCGPRGSLVWTKSPLMKIGVDVLIPEYMKAFGEEMIQHEMMYITSSEDYIPIPTESVDYVCTINSLDHVNNLELICRELLRVLKKSGYLLASFNLNEAASECEPQTLTEEILDNYLLKYFDIESYRLAYKGKKLPYENLYKNNLIDKVDDKEAVLWVRGKKK